MSRDPHKQAVYHAEFRFRRWLDTDDTVTVFGSTWVPEPEVKFGDVGSVQHYVDKVLAHLGWKGLCSVRERRGETKAHYEPFTATIALPPRRIGGTWSLRETVVLHELAHHLTRHDEAHGAAFARAMVWLHEQAGYPVRARLLSIAFAEADVPVAVDNRFR